MSCGWLVCGSVVVCGCCMLQLNSKGIVVEWAVEARGKITRNRTIAIKIDSSPLLCTTRESPERRREASEFGDSIGGNVYKLFDGKNLQSAADFIGASANEVLLYMR